MHVAEGEEPVAQPGPVFVDGGFGEDGQPLTHASRAKVVVRQAKTGKRVVRLMSGDPFVYASGPEEALACTKAGVGFEIVPGVSSVTAVPAYAGIPLTTKNHREVAVVTCSDARIDWSAYADAPDAGAALGGRLHRRDRRRAGRGGSRRDHAGLDDPHRHADHAGDDRLHAGRHRRRRHARRR